MNIRKIASSVVRRVLLPMTPPDRRLALAAWSNRNFEGSEPELRLLDRIVPGGCRTAVDAGANVGLYTFRLARLARTVEAFEINPGVTADLASANLPNVRLVHTGLSDSERNVTLYVPLLDGNVPLYGWASLSRGNCPATDVEMELPGAVRTLDSFALKDVDFIKIDVEGHELEVLRGARGTLSTYRPRILAEARDPTAVATFLAGLGYRATRAQEFGVADSAPWMHVFEAR